MQMRRAKSTPECRATTQPHGPRGTGSAGGQHGQHAGHWPARHRIGAADSLRLQHVFNRTGSMEGPPCAQPGRHWSHGSHGPGTLISEADWQSQGKQKVPLESLVGSKRCVCRTVYNGAVRSKLIFPITLLSWHAWTMMHSSRSADVGHPSIHRRIVRIM